MHNAVSFVKTHTDTPKNTCSGLERDNKIIASPEKSDHLMSTCV